MDWPYDKGGIHYDGESTEIDPIPRNSQWNLLPHGALPLQQNRAEVSRVAKESFG